MASIKELKDNNNETIFPVTHSSAIFDSNGNNPIEDILRNKADKTYVDEKLLNAGGSDVKVGDLNELQTDAKTSVVDAINELFQSGNNVKQKLVDTLIAGGVTDVSTNNSFDELIARIYDAIRPTVVNPTAQTIGLFNISDNQTIVLQNGLRGDVSVGEDGIVMTDWGDGTINTELSHTYTNSGIYQISSKYSLVSTEGVYDASTVASLREILSINPNIRNASYLFYNCEGLLSVTSDLSESSLINTSHMFEGCINLPILDVSNWNTKDVVDMRYMFNNCAKLTVVNAENWDLSSLVLADYMFLDCVSLL